MAELILVIWKFLRNFIYRQMKSNRSGQQVQEDKAQSQQSKSRGTKRTRKAAQSESESSGEEKTDSEGKGS